MDQRSSEAATDQEAEAEDCECRESSRFSELFRPGGEAVVHIDPSPLRQAIRVHMSKYAGVTEQRSGRSR